MKACLPVQKITELIHEQEYEFMNTGDQRMQKLLDVLRNVCSVYMTQNTALRKALQSIKTDQVQSEGDANRYRRNALGAIKLNPTKMLGNVRKGQDRAPRDGEKIPQKAGFEYLTPQCDKPVRSKATLQIAGT